MMKGLQGERLRQAFKHLDQDQDGFIRPDQFKRIVMVWHALFWLCQRAERSPGNCGPQAL